MDASSLEGFLLPTNSSFFGKTLYCPPIVNSPNGKPQTIRNDNTITIEKTPAPITAIMVNLQIPIPRSI